MDKQGDIAPLFDPDLADRFEERQRFDIADRAADFGNDHVRFSPLSFPFADATLDLLGNMRDDLNGGAEVIAAPFVGDHRV